MKKTIHILALIAAFTAVVVGVHAQVNRVTGPGVLDFGGAAKVNSDGELKTYSATVTGLVPAASATDVACLAGSATKTVRAQSVRVSGTAGTLITLPVLLRKNASADSGGTTVAVSFTPYAHLSTDAANTATVTAYTANPTVNDTVPGVLDAQTLTLPVTSAGTSSSQVLFTWSGQGGTRAPVLVGVAQQLCVNLGAVSVTTGSLSVRFTWTEE